jgi:hypothetical protein
MYFEIHRDKRLDIKARIILGSWDGRRSRGLLDIPTDEMGSRIWNHFCDFWSNLYFSEVRLEQDITMNMAIFRRRPRSRSSLKIRRYWRSSSDFGRCLGFLCSICFLSSSESLNHGIKASCSHDLSRIIENKALKTQVAGLRKLIRGSWPGCTLWWRELCISKNLTPWNLMCLWRVSLVLLSSLLITHSMWLGLHSSLCDLHHVQPEIVISTSHFDYLYQWARKIALPVGVHHFTSIIGPFAWLWNFASRAS